MDGMNFASIPDGVIANVNVTLAATASGTIPIQVGNLVAVGGDGNAIPISGQPGNITIYAPVSVVISPGVVNLFGGQKQQFTATVTGGSGNTAVTWSLSPNVGSVGGTGLYTAPATVNTQQTVTVTATSAADATKSASAAVTLLAPVTVTLNPSAVTLSQGQTQQFTASVTGGSGNTAVTWSLSPNVGSVSGTGLYTAPATVNTQQTVTVTATSAADATKSAGAIMTLVPPSGLVTAYPFDEGSGSTVADASGTGINGTTNNTTWTTAGKYGNALSFNGSTSYVDLGKPAVLQTTGSMSWSAWIRATGNPADDGQIVSSSTDGAGWQFKTSPDTGVRTFAVAVTPTGGSSHTQRYSKTKYSLNTWYYVAGVYNATAKTLDIYVNGVLDDGVLVGTVPNAQAISGVNATIGRRDRGYYFKGIIDNLRIYNRALSVVEIQSDMNTPITQAAGFTLISDTARNVRSALGMREQSITFGTSPQRSLSGLSCAPKVVTAGGRVRCEVRVTAAGTPAEISLASSSVGVKIPHLVTGRPNQSSLGFEAVVEREAKQETVRLAAQMGESTAEETLLVLAGAGPVLRTPDRQIVKWGEEVRFAVSAVDPGNLPVELGVKTLPEGASFDGKSGQFAWSPEARQTGKYRVTFTARNTAAQESIGEVQLEVGRGSPVVESREASVCTPEGIGRVWGKWLSDLSEPQRAPAGTTKQLGDTQVRVNAEAVPVLLSSATHVEFLCPGESTSTEGEVVVETAGGRTQPVGIQMKEAEPRILEAERTAEPDQGWITFAATGDLLTQRDYREAGYPAQPGDEVTIWATGLGPEDQVWLHGLGVEIGGVNTAVEAIVPAAGYAGVSEIRVKIPEATIFGDQVPVRLIMRMADGRQLSSKQVTTAIEPVRQ